MAEPSTPLRAEQSPFAPHLLLTLLAGITFLLFIVRVTGPSNLMDNDQERPASYVLDAVLNGHWFCQCDWTGDIMSKPPLFTWLAAVATLPVGHGNLGSLYFPCLVAMLLTVGLLFRFGSDHFGWRVAFIAGLMYLAAPSGVKHITLARTDGLFAATIALTAFMAFRAWTGRGSWVWFWFAAALATLTKGPLGPVLGAMGLLAAGWEAWSPARPRPSSSCLSSKQGITKDEDDGRGRSVSGLNDGNRRKASLPSMIAGVALFILITGGWFWLAYREAGQPFIDKVIGRELVGHMVSDEHGTFGIGFLKAPLYWLSRFLPWSLLAVVGLWRVFRHPATEAKQRRFERFLACWILGGLLLFSLAKHQRGDLPLPLYPPAALLAAREVARWLRRWPDAMLVKRSVTAVLAALVFYAGYLHTVFARTDEVRESEGVESLARQLKPPRADLVPELFLHVDSPYALQFHLNTMNRSVSFEIAAGTLESDEPVVVAVANAQHLQSLLTNGGQLIVVGRWPETGEARVQVVANRGRATK